MARTSLTVKEITERNQFVDGGALSSMAAAVDATDGAEFVMKERDDKYLILATNAHATDAKNVTIKAGNGFQAGGDLTFSVAAGKIAIVSIDSGRYKNLTGTDKGKVVITGGSADIKVAVFRLP